jgi:hypothetical protein
MIATKAKKEFKKRFGQANHLLITTLIGLNSIESGVVTQKPEGFSTSWNPKDPKRSAERARIFSLQSFLGWAVESLEMYLTELNRKPKELESEEFTSIYSKAGRSVYQKAIGVGEYTGVDPLLIALMEVLITWRNYTFHYDIDNEIREKSKVILMTSEERIRKEFCDLEIGLLQKTWGSRGDFSFKETASLINATHKFVAAVDSYAIANLDFERYVTDALDMHFSYNDYAMRKLKSLPHDKKLRFLRNVATQILGVKQTDDSAMETNITMLVESYNNKNQADA